MANTAFVIGNGVSRKGIDLNLLNKHGTVYACNAIYRDYDPDYLVAVDPKMIFEINESGYQNKLNNVWTNSNKRFEELTGFNYFEKSLGWSSGPTALHLASEHDHDVIYILGFDYMGVDSGKRYNNVYANTKNYMKEDNSAIYYHNWLRQTEDIFRKYPRIRYCRIIRPDNLQTTKLNSFVNYTTMLVDDFHLKLEI
ncbi:MAG: hypothetical protein ACKVJK_00480 [Methylophagaceae bacterium]|jgi:hypothetical protein|tara:strand:- start:1271 stop:1861 length:591 start_codon:yes stop_codon:yes gene_type:complete